MAQDLFLCPLEGSPTTYERKLITDILSRGASRPVTCFECLYPDGSRGESHGIDEERDRLGPPAFTHFGGRTMMERIYELADALDVFVCWSCADVDQPNACVTRADRLGRLPAGAEEALIVEVARDADHLCRLVKGAGLDEWTRGDPTPP